MSAININGKIFRTFGMEMDFRDFYTFRKDGYFLPIISIFALVAFYINKYILEYLKGGKEKIKFILPVIFVTDMESTFFYFILFFGVIIFFYKKMSKLWVNIYLMKFTHFFRFFLTIFIIIICVKYNIAFCGEGQTNGNPITNIQHAANQAILEDMRDDELDEYLRLINYPIPGHTGWEAVDRYHGYGDGPGGFNYEAFLIWLAASTVLFIISQWGGTILSYLFSLPGYALEAAPHFYTGFSAFMRGLGHAAIYRQEVLNYTLAQLNNPDTAAQVQFALNAYLVSRGAGAPLA